MKWKELNEYDMIRMREEDAPSEKWEANYCKDCFITVGNPPRPKEHKRIDMSEAKKWNDMPELKNSHECAFIGNTSYKDICKYYKITQS